jgi:hypothetical protein
MTLLDVAVYLVVAGACGAVARAFGGGTGGGGRLRSRCRGPRVDAATVQTVAVARSR